MSEMKLMVPGLGEIVKNDVIGFWMRRFEEDGEFFRAALKEDAVQPLADHLARTEGLVEAVEPVRVYALIHAGSLAREAKSTGNPRREQQCRAQEALVMEAVAKLDAALAAYREGSE